MGEVRVLLTATVDWLSVARFAQGFQAVGCSVALLAPAGSLAALSRHIRQSFVYNPFAPIRSTREAATKSVADLVVPCDERALVNLLQLEQRERRKDPNSALGALIRRSLGDLGSYPRILSRYSSLAAMANVGVRVARTYRVRDEDQLGDCLEESGLPAVLKADGSWGGDGVIVAKTSREARAAFRLLAAGRARALSIARAAIRRDVQHLLAALTPKHPDICVQAFVEGTPASSAFAAWKGEVVASFHYAVLLADAVTGPANVIRRLASREMDYAVEMAARTFGLSGLHGLDFICDHSGNAYLIEINPRATQGGTLAFGAGHDLPAGLATMGSSAAAAVRPEIENDLVVFFPREWLRDPKSEYLAVGHHEVPWDDPAVLNGVLLRHGVSQAAAPVRPTKA